MSWVIYLLWALAAVAISIAAVYFYYRFRAWLALRTMKRILKKHLKSDPGDTHAQHALKLIEREIKNG